MPFSPVADVAALSSGRPALSSSAERTQQEIGALDRMEDEGKAGDEHGDGGERGEILDEVQHVIVPCLFVCSCFVPF
jgi:hypothetical protein